MHRESDTGDYKWMRNMLNSGTLTDKANAMTVLVQSDPLHNLETIDSLMEMAHKKGISRIHVND